MEEEQGTHDMWAFLFIIIITMIIISNEGDSIEDYQSNDYKLLVKYDTYQNN